MCVRVYENLKHFEEACSVLECIRDVAGRQQNVRSDETVKYMEEAIQTSPSKSISVTTTKLKLFCVTSLPRYTTRSHWGGGGPNNDHCLYYSTRYHLRN